MAIALVKKTPTAAQVRAEIDSNSTQLAAIVEDTGTTIPAQITAGVTVSDKTGFSLSTAGVSAIVSAVFSQIIEGSITFIQSIRIRLAALVGKTSGAETGTIPFRDTADSKTRFTAVCDTDGNRDTITMGDLT